MTIDLHRLSPLGLEVRTLDAALATRAAEGPGELAFAMDGERLTYGQLREEAEALARGLARLGVERGDRVALALPAGLDFVRAFFALQRLGATPCAFDPAAPAAALERRAERVRPRLVLVPDPEPEADGAGMQREDLKQRELGAPASSRLQAKLLEKIRLEAGAPTKASAGAEGRPEDAAGARLRRVPLGEVRRAAAEGVGTLPPPDDPEVVAFLQPTSGTAGEPRAAVVLQRHAIASLRAAREMVGLGPSDVLVSWVPPWHDLGLMRFVLGPVYFGAPCHLVEPAIRTLSKWLRTASEVRATVIGAPDFAYRLATRLVDPKGLDLSALRCATNGGEPVRSSTIEAFERRFGVPGVIRPGYGLAEATLGVTGLCPGEPLRVDERGNVTCGRPLPGVEVRIAVAEAAAACPTERREEPPPQGRAVAPSLLTGIGANLKIREGRAAAPSPLAWIGANLEIREGRAAAPSPLAGEGRGEGSSLPPSPPSAEVGEILVRSAAVFAGYFDAPEATAEALQNGWLHTGDIGRLDADRHLYVLGRKRALLKRGGAPLAPREVEEAVEEVPGLRVAAAVGLPAAEGTATEEIALAIEADPAADPAQVAGAVAAAVEAALGFAPDRIVVLAPHTLPRTANGKVRHDVLRQALIAGELEASGAVVLVLAGAGARV